jgi:hypothetical protein
MSASPARWRWGMKAGSRRGRLHRPHAAPLWADAAGATVTPRTPPRDRLARGRRTPLDECAGTLRRPRAPSVSDALLDRREPPSRIRAQEPPRHEQPRLEPGEHVELLRHEELVRAVDAFRPYQLGVLQGAAQVEVVGGLVRDRDAHARTVDVGDGADLRPGRHEVGCLDLQVGRGKRNHICPRRLGGEALTSQTPVVTASAIFPAWSKRTARPARRRRRARAPDPARSLGLAARGSRARAGSCRS